MGNPGPQFKVTQWNTEGGLKNRSVYGCGVACLVKIGMSTGNVDMSADSAIFEYISLKIFANDEILNVISYYVPPFADESTGSKLPSKMIGFLRTCTELTLLAGDVNCQLGPLHGPSERQQPATRRGPF